MLFRLNYHIIQRARSWKILWCTKILEELVYTIFCTGTKIYKYIFLNLLHHFHQFEFQENHLKIRIKTNYQDR